jgi:hypothetical protein
MWRRSSVQAGRQHYWAGGRRAMAGGTGGLPLKRAAQGGWSMRRCRVEA